MTTHSRRQFIRYLGATTAAGYTLGLSGIPDAALAVESGGAKAPSPFAIDIHAHLPLARFGGPLASRFGREPHGNDADALDERKLALAIQAEGFDAVSDFHRHEMNRWGIRTSALMQIDFGQGGDTDTQWAEAEALASLARLHEDRYLFFFGCDPRRPDAIDRLERAALELGATGVKVHPLAGFPVDDAEACLPYYRKCEQLGLPVLGHCRKLGLGPRDEFYKPERYGNVASILPGLKICMGHMGGPPWREEALEQLERHENLYGDLSFFQPLFAEDPEALFAFLKRVLDGPGRERIMFGTDWPNGRAETGAWLEAIRSGGTPSHSLSSEEIELVLRRNAEAFLGRNPPVNPRADRQKVESQS